MAVSVDGRSIRAQLRRFGGEHLLLVVRSQPVLAAGVVEAAAVAVAPVESTPWLGSVMVVPAGVVLGLEGDLGEIDVFVDRLAVELGSRTEVDVVLGAARDVAMPRWLDEGGARDDSVSVWMVHALSDQLVDVPWAVGEEATRRLAAAVGAEVELPDLRLVTIDAELTLDYAGVPVADAVPALVRVNPLINTLTARRDPLRVLSSYFRAPGTVSVRFGRPVGDVRGVVDAGRRLLVASPGTEVYGAVLTGRPYDTPERLLWVGASDYWHWSAHWDVVVPDVFGVQVLGEGHLARVRDLSGWVTTALGAGRYLVEARDLGAWFEGPVPDPGVLAKARADFAGVILTAELMAQLPTRAMMRVATARSRGTLAGGDGR